MEKEVDESKKVEVKEVVLFMKEIFKMMVDFQNNMNVSMHNLKEELRDDFRKRFEKLEKDISCIKESQNRLDDLQNDIRDIKENQKWTDLRFSALREAISIRPSSGRRLDVWPHYGPFLNGCNSKCIVRYSESTI